jgi:hypothetical protein
MKKYLERGGSNYKKYDNVDKMTLEAFISMRDDEEEVHDNDLIDAALNAAEELGLTEFKASASWLLRFKKKYRIVSRKVTAYVTSAQLDEREELDEMVEAFRCKIKRIIPKIPLSSVNFKT